MDNVIKDNTSCCLPATHSCKVNWSAVIAGTLVAFGLGILFNLLNAGFGLINYPEVNHSLIGIGAGGYIWLLICSIITMFFAGWVAGGLANPHRPCFAGIHGFLAWALALFLTVFFALHLTREAAEPVTMRLFFLSLIQAISAIVGGYVGAKKMESHTH